MKISAVRQELVNFCTTYPQPQVTDQESLVWHNAWVRDYAHIYAKYPWYYKVWAEFAGRYVQANSWYLRCGAQNLMKRMRRQPIELQDE